MPLPPKCVFYGVFRGICFPSGRPGSAGIFGFPARLSNHDVVKFVPPRSVRACVCTYVRGVFCALPLPARLAGIIGG
jgi:hypothetical protein